MPDNPVDTIVASAASSTYFEPVLDVGGSPLHVPSTRLQAALAEHQFPYACSSDFRSNVGWDEMVEFCGDVGSPAFQARSGVNHSILVELADGLAVIEFDSAYNRWEVTVAATDQSTADRYMQGFAEFLPAPPPPPPPPELPHNVIPVAFWMQSPYGGASARWRDITIHDYNEVKGNYSASVRDSKPGQHGLDSLMRLDDPSGGKLILFHGPPGTGKTRAILTLMSEWREWCTPSVVTDADRFLDDPTYMNDLLFNADGGWILLVIEDGDEFLNVDGRESKGQAIARLLNMADGIVGQGLNLMTLISTNVDVEKLNPAVIREGRCLANLHFGAFSPEDAAAWCAERGLEDAEFDSDVTLAQMYARLAAAGLDTTSDEQPAEGE